MELIFDSGNMQEDNIFLNKKSISKISNKEMFDPKEYMEYFPKKKIDSLNSIRVFPELVEFKEKIIKESKEIFDISRYEKVSFF